jgi:hypothetical protein
MNAKGADDVPKHNVFFTLNRLDSVYPCGQLLILMHSLKKRVLLFFFFFFRGYELFCF